MNTVVNSQDAVNLRVYHRAGVEETYRERTLTLVEAFGLLKYQRAFAGKDVLDIGVGTGRTSIYLAPLSRRYEGIDYSPVMVRHLQKAMPGISVRLADMRRMTNFDDGSFDFVFAPNCVFDAVGHDDRLLTLRECHRLLCTGGMLMFTAHNRNYVHALRGPRLKFSRDPFHQVARIFEWLRQLMNHSRIKPLRSLTPEYALLNDAGHDFACLHYYIGQIEQRQQLAHQGFEVVEVLDLDGQSLAAEDPAPQSARLMFVAKRIPSSPTPPSAGQP